MMNSKICEMLDIEFPLVAFTHCRDVVVAVSKAGGCGVLGAVGWVLGSLLLALRWSLCLELCVCQLSSELGCVNLFQGHSRIKYTLEVICGG